MYKNNLFPKAIIKFQRCWVKEPCHPENDMAKTGYTLMPLSQHALRYGAPQATTLGEKKKRCIYIYPSITVYTHGAYLDASFRKGVLLKYCEIPIHTPRRSSGTPLRHATIGTTWFFSSAPHFLGPLRAAQSITVREILKKRDPTKQAKRPFAGKTNVTPQRLFKDVDIW